MSRAPRPSAASADPWPGDEDYDGTSLLGLRDPDTVNIDHDPDVRCYCVADHTPQPVSYDVHHIVPLSWGGPRTADNERVVCPTVHRVAHYALTALRLGRDVDWRRITPYARDLAHEGWDRYQEAQP